MKFVGAGEFEELGYVDAEDIFPEHPTEDDCRAFAWLLPEIGPDSDHCDAIADWDEVCDFFENPEKYGVDGESSNAYQYVVEDVPCFGWNWMGPLVKAGS